MDYVDEATVQLGRAGISAARAEAEQLAAHVWKQTPAGAATPTKAQIVSFRSMVARRCDRVPLEHLTGFARFRSLDLLVGPGVFVPQPETSSVVDWTVQALRARISAGEPHPVCVDLCTGSGTMALSVAHEVPDAVVHAAELDPGALVWAARNAEHHRLRVTLHEGDIAQALPDFDGQLDLVMSNPPYVATSELGQVRPEVRDHDPAIALTAGVDGLDLIRSIEATARRLLKPGGVVVVEHSDRQGFTAPAVFLAGGAWVHIQDHPDHDQLDRFVTAERI